MSQERKLPGRNLMKWFRHDTKWRQNLLFYFWKMFVKESLVLAQSIKKKAIEYYTGKIATTYWKLEEYKEIERFSHFG